MKIKHLFFDLDGTLTNSGDGIIDCLKHTFEIFNIDYSNLHLKKYIGPPLETTFKNLIGNDQKVLEEMLNVFREKYLSVLETDKLYDGVSQMLKNLYDLGFDINLATSKPEVYAIQIMERLGVAKYFNHLCGAYIDGIQEKEEVLFNALKLSNADRNKSLMIGDRKYDLNAAENLGLKGIGVLYGFGEKEELENCKHIYLAETPLHLHNYIVENKGDY